MDEDVIDALAKEGERRTKNATDDKKQEMTELVDVFDMACLPLNKVLSDCGKVDHDFLVMVLRGVLFSLVMNYSCNVDEALRIIEDVKKDVIEVDNLANKKKAE